MFERLIRSAPALLTGMLVVGVPNGALGGAENVPAAAESAVIELRKSFRPVRRAVRPASGPQRQNGERGDTVAPDAARSFPPSQLGVAAALGEHLQTSGTLHLPGVGPGGLVLHGSTTPILETAAGRHLIIDRDRTIDPVVVDRISRRWPGYSVVQPPARANLRDVLGSVLDAAGYDSVLRSAPLIFGRGVTIRFTPDFVVLRGDRDLLEGQTRAISVVDPADALPAELRELAGEQRVLVVELTPDGAPAAVERAPWRDFAGRVTTIEAARGKLIIEEVAGACGCTVERRVPLPAAAGEAVIRADLRISRDGVAAFVFDRSDRRSQERPTGRDDMAIEVNSAADLQAAIGELLGRFGITAIGPVVEFYRAPSPGSTRRFVISVPGWLAEPDGRRLLITGTTVPPLVRLYLTRADIDILEYRIRDGR